MQSKDVLLSPAEAGFYRIDRCIPQERALATAAQERFEMEGARAPSLRDSSSGCVRFPHAEARG
jgi:hypothetical protein